MIKMVMRTMVRTMTMMMTVMTEIVTMITPTKMVMKMTTTTLIIPWTTMVNPVNQVVVQKTPLLSSKVVHVLDHTIFERFRKKSVIKKRRSGKANKDPSLV